MRTFKRWWMTGGQESVSKRVLFEKRVEGPLERSALADSGVISFRLKLCISQVSKATRGAPCRTKDLRRGTATMDKKEIRRIAQHTFTNQQSNEDSWYGSAISFHEGAEILWQHTDSIRLVVLMNAAMSIELLLKAIIVAKGGIAPHNHELLDLAR